MRRKGIVFCFFIIPLLLFSQGDFTVTGFIKDSRTQKEIGGVLLKIEPLSLYIKSESNGLFAIKNLSEGTWVLELNLSGYKTVRIPVLIANSSIDLGVIFLENDLLEELSEGIVNLAESDFDDGTDINFSSGLLQATKDVFLTRAAFDFSQAFFNVKGYDSREGEVLINGTPINKIFNGRPQYNNWGGLNDVTRNQIYSNGLSPSEYSFGGILGTTNINTRASSYRPGLRVSISGSNRTYSGRLIGTYNSGLLKNGLAYSISASRRVASQGFIDGTFYDAFSLFSSLEYKISEQQSINFTGIFASNRRGQSTAITEEVFNLVGRNYNPFWGILNGEVKNTRARKIQEPIFMFNHFFDGKKIKLNSSITYQFGQFGRTRISFFNAPNPDPINFRALPSFYINSNGAPSFENAILAREGFLTNPQINFDAIFQANESSNSSSYLIQEDRTDDTQLTFNTIANIHLNNRMSLNTGFTYRKLTSDNYALLKDLLGSAFHLDIDPFSNTQNNLQDTSMKIEGDRFGYNYLLSAEEMNLFTQLQFKYNKWNAFLSGKVSQTTYEREGKFLNERFSENSLGVSEKAIFSNFGIKGGLGYKINERHIFNFKGSYITRAPTLQNTFINPRENNAIVPNLSEEKITTATIDYLVRFPKIKARFTGFYTLFENSTDINFFFVEGGFGSDFVQEVTTGISQRHIGGEFGLEFKASPTVKLTLVGSIGDYTYTSDAAVSISFDTFGDNLINTQGSLDLGNSSIKGLKTNDGPQQAYALGIEYRDPKYWWIGTTINRLSNNFISISRINRTESFKINPETGLKFPEATDEAVDEILEQEAIAPVYLVNLIGGKSWLINGKYISVFVSINNALDFTFRSGGFEQSRAGNFERLRRDNLRDNPSFGPRHWYGFGRTFFINLSVNF